MKAASCISVNWMQTLLALFSSAVCCSVPLELQSILWVDNQMRTFTKSTNKVLSLVIEIGDKLFIHTRYY